MKLGPGRFLDAFSLRKKTEERGLGHGNFELLIKSKLSFVQDSQVRPAGRVFMLSFLRVPFLSVHDIDRSMSLGCGVRPCAMCRTCRWNMCRLLVNECEQRLRIDGSVDLRLLQVCPGGLFRCWNETLVRISKTRKFLDGVSFLAKKLQVCWFFSFFRYDCLCRRQSVTEQTPMLGHRAHGGGRDKASRSLRTGNAGKCNLVERAEQPETD